MSILSNAEVLNFLDISENYFTINASNNILYLKYNAGTSLAVTITSGTYTGDTLAAVLKSVIDAKLTCTSTITYSSTTLKFTFAAGGANTFTYTHANSTAASVVGFNQDHAASTSIVSDIICGIDNSVIFTIRDAIEKAASDYCKREFVSTSYKKKYDGTGTNKLLLNDYPVTSLTRLAMSYIDAINISNTSSAYHASVGVTSTGVVLTQESTSDSTVLFATYDTLTKVVNAINLISGWSATLSSSTYGDYPSAMLREVFGLYCGQNTIVSLTIPDQGMYNYEVDINSGIITLPYNFPTGTKNVYVEYTAGYSSATMPENLKLAIKIWIDVLYRKQQESSFGLTSFSTGGISRSLISEMPKEVENLLSSYKRYII